MLVLSRKRNEVVDLFFKNDKNETSTVSCMILGIEDNKVKLGFDAKDKVKIMRKEIESETPRSYFPMDEGRV